MAKETKSQIQGIEGVSGAIKKLTEMTKLLNAEQKKQIDNIKKSDEANVKLSTDVAKVGKLYTGVQKNIEELTKTQIAYNQKVAKQRQALLENTEKIIKLEEELSTVQKKRKELEEEVKVAIKLNQTEELERLNEELKRTKQLEKTKQKNFDKEKETLQVVIKEYDIQAKKVDLLTESVKEHTKAIEEAEQAYEEYKKGSDEAFQTAGNGLERTTILLKGVGDHINEIAKMSSLGDISRSAEGFAQTIRKAGDNIVMMNGGFSKFGSFLSTVGKGMGAMLGPISAIVSIAEVLMGAEKDQKDFNKSILEGGGALQFMTKETDNLHENLNTLRKGMLDADNLLSLGMSADEIKSSLNSLQEMNITLEEMGGRGSNITQQFEGARNVIGEMKTISTVFGVSIDEVGAHIETLHGTLGRTLDDAEELKEIKTSFDLIRDAAAQAGYSNKKFFSTVISVTNEVANMSGRISEAGALFKNLRKLLGKKGEEILELSKEGYKGKGLQDRYTEVKKVGGKNVSKILEREAMAKSIALFKSEGGLYSDKQSAKIGSALNVDLEKLRSGDADAIKQLTKMSVEDRKAALEKIRRDKDLGADVANQIQDLFTLTKGIGAGAEVQARSIEKLGMGGNLAMLANKLNFIGMSADKLANIDLDSAVNQKLLEDTYGADKAGAMKDMLTRGKEDFIYYTKKAKEMSGMAEGEEKDKLKKELQEAGFKVGDKGQLLAAGTGKEISSLTGFIQAMPERFEALSDLAETAKSQEELLQESIDATVSSSEALGAILKEKLDFLGDYTSWIFTWLSGGDEDAKAQKIEEQNKLKKEISLKQEDLSEAKKQHKELEEQRKKTKDPIKQKELDEEIQKSKADIEARKLDIKKSQETQTAFRKSGTKDIGSAENVRRYEEAMDIYNMTEGTHEQKLEAVGQKDVWLKKELETREALRTSTDEDDQKKLRQIESGALGGSAFEDMKAKEAYDLAQSRRRKRHGVYDPSAATRDIERKYADIKYKPSDTTSAIYDRKKEEKVDPKVEEEKAALLVKEERKDKEKNKNRDQEEEVKTLVKADDESRKKADAEAKASAISYLIEDAQKKGKTLTQEAADKLYEEHKVTSNPVVQAALAATSATPVLETPKDMILSDKGAFKLDSKDQVVAMKTGGAIDQYLKGGGGRGNVTININGGDEARIFEVVKRAMSTAGVVTQGMK